MTTPGVCPEHGEQCIEAGDPRYDGFRITELFVATSVDPKDNQEGLIADMNLGGMLMAADRNRLTSYVEPYVEQLKGLNPDRTFAIKHFVLAEET